jgi:hypothetical protein
MEDELSGKYMEELQQSFFFTDVTLVWNQSKRAFTSQGDLGLRSMNKSLIERKINGKIEITKRRGGDDFVMYLQHANGSWYYFKYQKGIMAAISSDLLFNNAIKEGQEKISKIKEDYRLRIASISDRNKFVRAQKQTIE